VKLPGGRSKSLEPASIKPKKTKDPAPGSYNIEEAIRKSQWGASHIHMISKAKIMDPGDKEKSAIPGVGKYKETEKGYRILSKPPTSLKRRR
jgi:hypothetical protein